MQQIMDNQNRFQGLKNLHQDLHSKKGFTNITSLNNIDEDSKHMVQMDNNVEVVTSNKETKMTGSLESLERAQEQKKTADNKVQGKDNLLNAVKSVYVDNDVKLTPPKIFVGNISYKISTHQLKEFFSSFGRVIYAQIVKDRIKKWSKGYGFVTFSNENEVQRVLQASEEELILDGRTLRVNRAEKKKRTKPIQKCNENDPKKSLEEFVQNYMESVEISECDDVDLSDETLVDENPQVDVSRLNDDMLLYIFKFLTVKDRVKIERVCKRWRHLARQTWLVQTHLDFKGVFVPFRGIGVFSDYSTFRPFKHHLLRNEMRFLQIYKRPLSEVIGKTVIQLAWKECLNGLTDRILLSLFKRGCQNLRSLDLSHSSRHLTDYAIHLIGQNCPELHEINLSGVNVTMRSLKEMSSKCSKIKKIKLQRCYEVGEKALWWLFKQCRELEHVDIGGNIRISGQCFFMLTEKCKTVIADDCMKLTDGGLHLLAKRCNSLEELSISNCLGLTDAGIKDVLMQCTKLRRFSFCRAPKQVSSQSLLSLRHLTELEELELAKQEPVNDSVLFVIGSNCGKLRMLNLEACHNVTDHGIQCLTSCLQLQKLVISYLDKVTDSGVEAVAQNGALKELHARSCVNLTDRAVEHLALHCPYLYELDLSGSERIRNRSLDILEEHLGDNELETMVITVGGTGVTMERVLETRGRHPNWDITTQNLSDHHLRVDFDPYMDMGRILPEYSDEEDEDEFHGDLGYDAEYYLAADDPSMWEYEEQWIS